MKTTSFNKLLQNEFSSIGRPSHKGSGITQPQNRFLQRFPHFHAFTAKLFCLAEIKKYRAHIKKKSEQVARLRKKLYKNGGGGSSISASSSNGGSAGNALVVGGGVADPSVQRLVDSCTKELNGHFRTLRHAQVYYSAYLLLW